MCRIELIYDPDCPNADAARDHLRRAMRELGLPQSWTEWNRSDTRSPDYAQHYGSPTVLVDGNDIAGVAPENSADSCRIYRESGGVPPVALIISAVDTRPARAWLRVFPTLPGLGAAFLPVGLCPACWPAYAGVLGALGMPFLLETRYVVPLVLALLLLAVGSLAWRATTRRGLPPFLVGLVGASSIVVGKFLLSVDWFTYSGLALLFVASLWNAWPKRLPSSQRCPRCAQTDGR